MTEAEIIEEKINRYYAQPYTPRFRVDAEKWGNDLGPADQRLISDEEFHQLAQRLRQLNSVSEISEN